MRNKGGRKDGKMAYVEYWPQTMAIDVNLYIFINRGNAANCSLYFFLLK
jgi:hypothetical protein